MWFCGSYINVIQGTGGMKHSTLLHQNNIFNVLLQKWEGWLES